MICPTCNHDNLPGSEQCANCRNDLTALDRPAAHDRVERSLMEDCVAQPRSRGRPVTLPPTATVGEAIRTMLARDIGAVLVVDDDGRLLGIFSERDLLTKVAGQTADYAGRPLREFMTRGPGDGAAGRPAGVRPAQDGRAAATATCRCCATAGRSA